MKIMTAMYTLRRGGAYDRFLMMLEAFLERNYEVHCLSLTPIQIKNPFYHNEVCCLPFKSGDSLVAKLLVLLLFPLYSFQIGWREKIDLFVAFGSLYAFILAIPKWILKRPMVTLIRGDFAFGLKMRSSFKNFLWLNKAVEYFGLTASDLILAVNKDIQKKVMKIVWNRKNIDVEILFNNILVSNHSIPIERKMIRVRYSIPEDAKILLTAGVLNRGKNIELLLKSFLRIEINNLFLFIIGEGTTKEDALYLDNFKKMIKELGLEQMVIFTGWLQKEELWRTFRASDLFILPSLDEGMSNVLLEALGLNLPCLGSKIPGVEDILQHEELMFDPLDVEALANKIRDIFSDVLLFEKVKYLCQERKKVFLFDWKETLFQIVTRKTCHQAQGLG